MQDWIKMENAPANRRKNSGQVLVITSLIVVMLLLSTVVYVTETEKNVPVYHPESNKNLQAIKQAAWHTVVSALVNISNGGDSNVFAEDLTRFKSAVESQSCNAILDLEFAAAGSDPYVDGLFLSWDIKGEGLF